MGNNEKLLKIRVSSHVDFRKKTPFSGLAPLETADLASSNLKIWLPHFCFILPFNFLLITTSQ